MKIIAGIFLLLLCTGAAAAQETSSEDLPSQTLKKGTWELGAFAGGGTGLGRSDNTQFFLAGGRIGWVLTGEHFSGWRRGNFEWAVDLMPLYAVFPPNGGVYGASIKPAIWQWNFTHGKKIAPYFAAAGGIVFSTHNLPPGNTSNINFTPQGAFGVHIFTREGRALLLEGAIVHHSNASLGTQNPGYNAAFLFTIGYSWFKTRR